MRNLIVLGMRMRFFIISFDGIRFIFFNKVVICPTSTLLHALITAPQLVWPRTTIILDFAMAHAYSILPKISFEVYYSYSKRSHVVSLA